MCPAQAQTHAQIQIAHFTSQTDPHMHMRFNMRKVLASTWPCATRIGLTCMWMHMAGRAFNATHHVLSVYTSERTKFCLNVRGVERAWNGVTVGHAVHFSLCRQKLQTRRVSIEVRRSSRAFSGNVVMLSLHVHSEAARRKRIW